MIIIKSIRDWIRKSWEAVKALDKAMVMEVERKLNDTAKALSVLERTGGVCIVVGHSQRRQGARNVARNLTEYKFNAILAESIFFKLAMKEYVSGTRLRRSSYTEHGTPVYLIHRLSTIKAMLKAVNALKPDLTVFLHCNAYEEKQGETEAHGTEVLVPQNSEMEYHHARNLLFMVSEALGTRPRAVVLRGRKSRGGQQLYGVETGHTIMLESFFIDNDSDLEKAEAGFDKLAESVAAWIVGMVEK